MKDCGAFRLIWDKTNTRIELITASAEIFSNLARYQILDAELMSSFWSLSKERTLKNEVFRILTNSKNLEEEHLEYIVDEINETFKADLNKGAQNQPVADKDQLSELELKLLADNVSFRRSKQKPRVTEFFWKVLLNSDKFKPALVEETIKQFDHFFRTDISLFEIFDLIKKFVEELRNGYDG